MVLREVVWYLNRHVHQGWLTDLAEALTPEWGLWSPDIMTEFQVAIKSMFSRNLHMLRYLFGPYSSESDCTDSEDDYESDDDCKSDDLEPEVIKRVTDHYKKNPGVQSMPDRTQRSLGENVKILEMLGSAHSKVIKEDSVSAPNLYTDCRTPLLEKMEEMQKQTEVDIRKETRGDLLARLTRRRPGPKLPEKIPYEKTTLEFPRWEPKKRYEIDPLPILSEAGSDEDSLNVYIGEAIERELAEDGSDAELPDLPTDGGKLPETERAADPELPRGISPVSSGWTTPAASPTPEQQEPRPEAGVRNDEKLINKKSVFLDKPEEKGWTEARKRYNRRKSRPVDDLNDRIVASKSRKPAVTDVSDFSVRIAVNDRGETKVIRPGDIVEQAWNLSANDRRLLLRKFGDQILMLDRNGVPYSDVRGRVAAVLMKTAHCTWDSKNGRRWFAYDGRPLNGKGVPIFTDEEKDMPFHLRPDLTKDKWGNPYVDDEDEAWFYSE